MSFHDAADIEKIIGACQQYQKALVVGAGLLGLEGAKGLSNRGMNVTVAHSNKALLNRQLDNEAGAMLQPQLSECCLHFKVAARSTSIEASERNGQQRVDALSFIEDSRISDKITAYCIVGFLLKVL